MTKTLSKLTITPSVSTVGKVEFGYETNLSLECKSRKIGRELSLDDLDFNSFVFDGGFFKTYIKRCFERNFNYIIFRFASKTNSDFGIEDFNAVFSINKELRGDR